MYDVFRSSETVAMYLLPIYIRLLQRYKFAGCGVDLYKPCRREDSAMKDYF